MYTRIYGADDKPISVPENYDGNAFREEAGEAVSEPPLKDPFVIHKEEVAPEIPAVKSTDGESVLSGLFKKLPLQSIFGNLGIRSLSSFKIGTEEILIAGIALFLFFSKSGDNELAFMLLLLLFVK